MRALSSFKSAEGREEERVTVNEPQGLNTLETKENKHFSLLSHKVFGSGYVCETNRISRWP